MIKISERLCAVGMGIIFHVIVSITTMIAGATMVTTVDDTKTSASREIRQYVVKFKSSDINFQSDAINFFEYMSEKKGKALPEDLSRIDMETYLKRWAGNSDKAALLLGRIGNKESVATLKKVKTDAEQIERNADIINIRKNLAPKVRLACLKSLLRLRDEDAVREVRSLLQSSTIEDRVRGVECVSFAETTTLTTELLPLLNDKNDAINIAPSGAKYFLRICDMTVNTITSIYKIKSSFVQHGERYSDEQIDEIRRAVIKFKTAESKPK